MKNRMNITSASLSRRDFNRLTVAAFGGMLLGTTLVGHAADKKAEHDPALLLQDKHVCRGLNTCKGKGKGGDNSCKGQGGCGEYPGQNSCKGLGSCEVPLKEKTWKTARKAFEAQMKKAGKTFGDAPKAKA